MRASRCRTSFRGPSAGRFTDDLDRVRRKVSGLTCPPFIGSPSHARPVVRSIPRARFEWAPNGSPAVLPGYRRRPNDESFFRHAIASRSSRLHVSRRLGSLSSAFTRVRSRFFAIALDEPCRHLEVFARRLSLDFGMVRDHAANLALLTSLRDPALPKTERIATVFPRRTLRHLYEATGFAALLLAPCSQLARCLLHRHS